MCMDSLVVVFPLRKIESHEELVFVQPAEPSGRLLDFDTVSVEGGPLVGSIAWQEGVLGSGHGGKEEDVFARKFCEKLEGLLVEIAECGL
jgi:hypothetical protein